MLNEWCRILVSRVWNVIQHFLEQMETSKLDKINDKCLPSLFWQQLILPERCGRNMIWSGIFAKSNLWEKLQLLFDTQRVCEFFVNASNVYPLSEGICRDGISPLLLLTAKRLLNKLNWSFKKKVPSSNN